jgi:DNA-directed RNA polymerase subunit RPC12/RpoP
MVARQFTLAMPGELPAEEDKKPGILSRLNVFTKAGREARRDKGDGKTHPLPIPLETYINAAGNVEKTPVTQFSWKFLRDLTYTSDLLALIVRTKTNETFRNGISITERYKSKCLTCGREFEEEKLFCPFDNGVMQLPDYKQWKVLNEFLKVMNRFDESFLTVMREVDTDVHIGDNGWLFLERAYEFDADGGIARDEVQGVLRFDPNMMRLIMSRYGMGTSETGTYVYFCPEHRMAISEFAEKRDDYKCTICGKKMLHAWYMSMTRAERIYYGPREIYHIKLYSNAQGYGVSPLMSCYMKINALLRMDKFILEAYSLQRAPQELLILRGKRESIHRAWEWLMQKARENPNMVYPLVLEGDDGSKSRVVEHETFSLKPIEWNWTDMRQEYRNVVGAVFGVQPIFSSGAQLQAGGLANEGLQLAVTTLAIKQEQHAWNMFLEFVSKQLGITDYIFKLNPNEQEDELRDLDVEQKRIQIAQTMTTMGYDIEVHKDAKGRLEFSYKQKLPQLETPEEQDGEPVEEDKDVPSTRTRMSPEDDRRARNQEQRRLEQGPPPPKEYSTVSAGLGKSNYTSKPDKKIKRNPRGDETADTTMVVETTTPNILESPGVGMP